MNNDDKIFEILENQREFDRYFLKKCPRGSVAETFTEYVNSNCFLELLDKMKNKTSDWNEGYGMLFPEDFDDPDNPDDEENIGENNICFYSGPDYEDYEDIIGYEEFYKYLVPACEFYVERSHPEHKEIVEQKLKEIREAYGLKKHNFWQNIYKLF